MNRAVLVLVFSCCLTATVPVDAVAAGGPSSTPSLVGVYPNPVADDDAGEFVVLDAPPDTGLADYRVCDAEGCLSPDRDASGRVVLTTAPERVRSLVDTSDTTVVAASGDLSLANGGERLHLRRGNDTVDVVRYEDAPESEVYRAEGPDGERRWGWRPLGASAYRVARSGPANVTAFTLPDAPDVVTGTLDDADDRLWLAGYTLSSDRVADELLAAHRRGVDVRVLVEGGPVGGISNAQSRVLDRLVRNGVAVRVVDGPSARYAYHHSKYAVVDDRALVLTENWKPAGTGGNSSRGWGVVVDDTRTTDRLATTFREDFSWRAARNWSAFAAGRQFEPSVPANGSYPRRITPETLRADRVRLLVAPDNAESGVRSLLGDATASVDVVQVGLGGPDGPFTRELLAAAERGVEVRVLLSGAWYVREENRALADRLNARAEREGLPLTVRLARPNGAFEKIHAKGAVVDGEHVVVGSLNWNAHAARENREVAVVLSGERVADYYGRVFERDWRADGGDGGTERVPVGALVALLAGVVVVLALARRFEFER